MKNYTLLPDEVLLFEGSCYLHDENRKLYNAMTVSMDTQCLLTNLSLVVVSTIKRAFQKPEIKVKKFPVNEIKMYNGTPPDQADRQGVHHLFPHLRSSL